MEFQKQYPDDAPNPWKTLSERSVYANAWIDISHREVINPGGGAGIYGKVHFKNVAIGILPIDSAGNTWLVGQYRYTLNQYSWEIVEGGGPHNEPLLDAAKRELLEETGLTAQIWTPLLEMHISNSVTDEYGVAYIATDLAEGNAEPEETELLEVRKMPFEEVFQMAMRGEITDSLSLATIFKAKLLYF
jgi:8-oxo-dGTP pyrophosphatase MutT (NUDIX family)